MNAAGEIYRAAVEIYASQLTPGMGPTARALLRFKCAEEARLLYEHVSQMEIHEMDHRGMTLDAERDYRIMETVSRTGVAMAAIELGVDRKTITNRLHAINPALIGKPRGRHVKPS